MIYVGIYSQQVLGQIIILKQSTLCNVMIKTDEVKDSCFLNFANK